MRAAKTRPRKPQYPPNSAAPAPQLDGNRVRMLDRATAMPWCDRLASALLHRSAGAITTIATPEDAVFEARGRIDEERASPPDSNTLFEIGSITKVFTSLLMAVLWLRGRIDPDAPIAAIVPEFAGVPAWITPRALSTHSSGLPSAPKQVVREALFRGLRNPYAKFGEQDLIEWMARYRPKRPPRPARFRYSNLGVGLLGYVLGRVHGGGYEAALIEEVLLPLGLDDTRIEFTPERMARFATPHYGRGKPTPHWDLAVLAGAGALRSTVTDLARFGLIVADAPRGTGPLHEAIRKTLEPQYSIRKNMEMCLGWVALQPKGQNARVYMHDGGTRGSTALLAVCPQAQFTSVTLANYGYAASIWGMIRLARANPPAVFAEIAAARMPVL